MHNPNSKRRKIAAILAALALLPLHGIAQSPASAYPTQPIKLVVPYPPGGGSDGLMRQLAHLLSKQLNTQVIVDNRPGANTMLGTEFAAKQPADGYTLLYVDSAFTINPALYTMRYSAIDSFEPIALITEIPLVVVTHNEASYKTVADLVTHSKAHPGKVTFASYGQGSRAHLAGEMLAMETNTNMLHIPFKGSADALNNLMGKHVDIAITTIEPALPLIKSGKIKVLAVTTPQRTSVLPETPTVSETIPGFSTVGWGGIAVPKGTHQTIIQQLATAIDEALKQPEVRDRVYHLSADAATRNASAMDKMLRTEIVKWKQVVQAANIKVN